jgi:hypothetical protein
MDNRSQGRNSKSQPFVLRNNQEEGGFNSSLEARELEYKTRKSKFAKKARVESLREKDLKLYDNNS